jgi:hypothetical protein
MVQDLATHGHNWFSYYENFHFLRQTHATQVSWALQLRSQNSAPPRSNTQSHNAVRPSPNVSVPNSLGPVYEFVCISFRTDNLNCFRAS